MKQRYLFYLLFQLLTISIFAQEGRSIRTKTGEFSRAKNLQNETLFTEALPLIKYKTNYYTLLQFSKLPNQTEQQALLNNGIRFYGYLPDNTYLAEVPETLSPAALKKFNVSGVYALEPAKKISLKLAANPKPVDPNQYVAVNFFGTVDKASVITALKQSGAQIADTKIQPENVVFIRASAMVIQKIAALPFVSYISSQRMKDVPINFNNRGSHGVNALAAPAGRNLQGKEITIGVGDNSDPTHTDFTGRLINRTPLPQNAHGTHTTGTAAGGGIVNEKYKGMAPQATIISQFYSDLLVNTPYYVTDFGMVLTNNSYHSVEDGCPGEGEYDVLSNFADAQMKNDIELLHVFAAGNDGLLTCTPFPSAFGTVKSGFQSAKNVLTVGSFDNLNYIISDFSSRGPVNDGRIKPEIIAGGSGITSTVPGDTYGANWGTSMAAPTVTGSLALLYERYRQLHGGSNPPASLMKALVCNTADDVDNNGPDYTHGFGLLNIRRATEALEANTYFTGTINHLGTATFNVTGIPAGARQLKVMLYWPDAAAAPFAPAALVNNLNLTVTSPDSVHRPLILSPVPGNVNAAAFAGVDNVNNIEQVVVNNPAAGDYTFTVTGANVPSGPQDFVVVYQLMTPTITLEFPFGNEKVTSGVNEYIKWNAYDPDTNPFTLEYSLNNGSTWTLINNNLPATSRNYRWLIPNTASAQALVRVTRNVTGVTDMSDFNFTILRTPNSLTMTRPCSGYVQITWATVTGATSYDIMMLQGDSMHVIGNTAALNYLVDGLDKDSSYWLAVRPRIGATPGRMSPAQHLFPNTGACAAPTYNNDVRIDSLIIPTTGRMFTSSQLGVVAPRVRIRNLGAVATAGSYAISYQINGGSVVTENSSTVIAATSFVDYTFTQTFDFSAIGSYSIKTWVTYTSDTKHKNDTISRAIKQLQNDALVLSPSFTEGFESATIKTYSSPTMGFDGVDRCDFFASNSNGRARTFVNSGFARSSNRAITLDQQSFSMTSTADSLITTFNLSGYSGADQLWLDFFYRNQGIDFSLPGNRVWIRGSEGNAWIPVFTLPINDNSAFGNYRAATPVNITEQLANAVPAQTISSSFQVKFGEQGFTSSNSVITNGNIDNGFTFDDVTITRSQNDVGVQAITNPVITNICMLGSAEQVSVRVKNYSSITLNNIAVSYRINGSTVTENIPSLTAGQVLVYNFVQTADLSVPQQYNLAAWVNYPTDNYRNNDSLLNIVFNTTPVINSFPYLEGFETTNGNWYTGGNNSSWEWGTPNKTIIDKAANGTKAWATSLTGGYNTSEFSFLYSPCFNLSGMTQPVLSFSHIFVTEDVCNCDFHWVEYSLDDVNWIKLGASGSGTNWYDNAAFQVWQASRPLWQVSSYNVPTTASKVRFRIVMYSDGGVNYEGVGIDDVHVFDRAAIYSGPNITSGLTLPVSGNNWIHFNMGSNRVVSINPNGQNLGNTEVKVYINTGGVRINTNQYYLDRNIVIQPSIAPSSPVSVRYYFLNTEMNALINANGCGICHKVNDAYEAGVTKYSTSIPTEENGTLDDNTTGVHTFIPPSQVAIIPYDNGYYAEYQVNSFSEFWINSGGPAQNQSLPIVLGEFTATKNNNTGILQWTTLQESNSDKFIIEKSGNSVSYSYLGEVQAKGYSTVTSQYSFIDEYLLTGVNYYRLKLVDRDGKSEYSPVRKLNSDDSEFTVDVFPNPVSQGTLYINTSVNANRLELRDVHGRIIKAINVQGKQHTLAVNHIAKGTYFLTIIAGSGKKIQKVFVE